MIKTTIGFILGMLFLLSSAQTYVYSSERMYFDQMAYTVLNGHILPGHSTMPSDAILTAHENKIYKGFSTIGFDVLYTINDGKVYTGSSTFLLDQIYTIKNGRIYHGDSTMMMDCLFTYDVASNKLYKGYSTFMLDAVLHFQGEAMKNAELLALLMACGML